MSDSARLSVAEELAELRTQLRAELLAELRGELAAQATPASRGGAGRLGRSWRPRLAAVAAVALAGVAFMGIATASTPGHPADVTFISLSVPHKILSNSSIGKAVTKSVLVIGGATTVPTDATSVQMTVAVKSTAAGSLSVFPADHASSATADTIAFPAGNVVVTQVSKQSPGLSSKVSFTNNGTAAAVVTVTITGYSTQTTASNISGSGGTSGQVLTNTGSGVAWRDRYPAGYTVSLGSGTLPARPSEVAVGTLNLPAGRYLINWTTTVWNTSFAAEARGIACILRDNSGLVGAASITDIMTVNTFSQLSGTTVTQFNGGPLWLSCSVNTGTVRVLGGDANMTAVRVSDPSNP